MEEQKYCQGCDGYFDSLEDYTGYELCGVCSEKYDNKTGYCSLNCSLGGGCDQTC